MRCNRHTPQSTDCPATMHRLGMAFISMFMIGVRLELLTVVAGRVVMIVVIERGGGKGGVNADIVAPLWSSK